MCETIHNASLKDFETKKIQAKLQKQKTVKILTHFRVKESHFK